MVAYGCVRYCKITVWLNMCTVKYRYDTVSMKVLYCVDFLHIFFTVYLRIDDTTRSVSGSVSETNEEVVFEQFESIILIKITVYVIPKSSMTILTRQSNA